MDGTLVRDERGFAVTGPDLVNGGCRPPGWSLPRDPYHLESSVPGVFAAGHISYRIVVNKHHGDIRVASRPGNTLFRVLLPLSPPEPPAG